MTLLAFWNGGRRAYLPYFVGEVIDNGGSLEELTDLQRRGLVRQNELTGRWSLTISGITNAEVIRIKMVSEKYSTEKVQS